MRLHMHGSRRNAFADDGAEKGEEEADVPTKNAICVREKVRRGIRG